MNKLSIYDSAHAFARETLEISGDFEIANQSVARFHQEKLHKDDFPYWNQVFRKARERMLQLKQQKSDSVKNAEVAAKATTAKVRVATGKKK